MLRHNPDKKLIAISFPGSTVRDLQYFVKNEHDLEIEIISPREFLKAHTVDDQCQYMNLVVHTNEMRLREEVSNKLDDLKLERFTYVHSSVFLTNIQIGDGVFMYPMSMSYPDAVIEDDVVVHGWVGISHKCVFKKGAFISGRCSISGGVVIGRYSWIGQCVTFYDNINIPDFTTIGAMSVITKDITEPGTWTTVYNKKLVKLS
jgi:UDP-3-O-[3-hydroxymyristoyl] glucosamine N-acyltransferase